MKLPVFITARVASERLPRKHFLPLGNIPVIEHVVRRCEHFGFEPFICVPKGDEGEFNAHTSCINVFGGGDGSIEVLLIEAAHNFKKDQFHHLDGDDPFFDEYSVIDSFNSVSTGLVRVFPSYQSQSGSGRVGTSYNLKGVREGRNLADRLELQPWPQRLTLDYEEDYHLICAVNRIVGGYMAPRWVVDELFVKNPDLHKINWFRNSEWKERQRHERR